MRPVWLLAASQGFQSLGTAVFAVSLALVAGETGDFRGLGLVLAAKTLPTIVVALFGGIAADRWKKKNVAVFTLLGTALTNFFIAFVVPQAGLGGQIQLLALLSGLIAAFGAPSLYSLLPSLVSKENNFRANALERTFRNGGMIAGPVIAGVLAQFFTASSGMWVSAVLPIAATAFILLLPLQEKANSTSSILGDVREALTFARHSPWFVTMLAFWGIFLAIQGGAAGVVQPVFVTQLAGANVWSMMATALALGYISGSLFATRWEIKTNLISGSILFVALSIFQILAVTLTNNLLVWLVASFIAGIGLEISGVAWGSALQTRVDEKNIGKVSSLDYAVSFGFVPVGYALYGFLGEAMDPKTVLGISSLVMISIALVTLAVSLLLKFDPRKPQDAATKVPPLAH